LAAKAKDVQRSQETMPGLVSSNHLPHERIRAAAVCCNRLPFFIAEPCLGSFVAGDADVATIAEPLQGSFFNAGTSGFACVF